MEAEEGRVIHAQKLNGIVSGSGGQQEGGETSGAEQGMVSREGERVGSGGFSMHAGVGGPGVQERVT